MNDLFSPDFQATPHWQTGAVDPVDLPGRADVVIVGSGYTGLSAALVSARGGRSVVVLDAGPIGGGCSTRNGAHISTSIKPRQADLAAKFGPDSAAAIRSIGREALDWVAEFRTREGIDIGFRRVGRFLGAHSARAYEAEARAAEIVTREEGAEAFAVPRTDQRSEIGSDYYHGGIVFPRYATLDAGAYHGALLQLCVDAGVTLVPGTAATGTLRDGDAFVVHTPRGPIAAQDVAIATNGYSGTLVPWLARRVIPIGSYVITTEELAADQVADLFPSGRMICDTRKVVYYFGPTSDGRRVIFGGRVTHGEADARFSGPRLHAEMLRIFPQLAGVKIARSWMGTVAYTFDQLPHCGVHEGMHYAMGYCGSGVSLSGYLGMRMGQRLLGLAEGRTALDDLPFPTRPFYRGRPWFLPAAIAWYGMRDRWEMRRR